MSKKLSIIISILNTFILTLLVFLSQNNYIAIHYGIDGSTDMWGNKWLFLSVPTIPLIISIVYYMYSRHSNRQNKKYENIISSVITIFFIIISWILYFAAFYPENNNNEFFIYLIALAIGILLVFISLFIPKLKRNKSLGIKTPWALKNDIVWDKTQRIGSVLGIFSGTSAIIISIISFLMQSINLCIYGFTTILILYISLTLIYSYLIYKKICK